MENNENKWQVTGRTGYILMHHGWKKGEEQFRNQFWFGLQYDHATVTEKEAEEKAAFIVRAVNSHDLLVEAVKSFIEYDSSNYSDGLAMMMSYKDALEKCKAALAAAESQDPSTGEAA